MESRLPSRTSVGVLRLVLLGLAAISSEAVWANEKKNVLGEGGINIESGDAGAPLVGDVHQPSSPELESRVPQHKAEAFAEENAILTKSTLGEMPVYVITMPKRVERVKEFLKQNELDHEGHIHPATSWKELNLTELVDSGKVMPWARFVNVGEIAISMSHSHAIDEFLETGSDYGIFFEDDVDANGELLDHLKKIRGQEFTMKDVISELAATQKTLNWEGLNLGHCFDFCGAPLKGTYLNDTVEIRSTQASYCAHSYILTREGAQNLRRYTSPMRTTEDGMRVALTQRGKFRYYSTIPSLYMQNRKKIRDVVHPSRWLPECLVEKGNKAVTEWDVNVFLQKS